MRRAVVRIRAFAVIACIAVLAAFAAPASAHPLGNFSINHLSRVTISSNQVAVHYILDQAEIPTFQERGLGAQRVLALKETEITRNVHLTIDGQPATLTLQPGAKISFPPGQGGLPLTRVEIDLSAPAHNPRRVQYSDQTFPDRIGWKAVEIQAGHGTAVKSSVPATDPTNGLRSYPKDLLSSPLNQRTATFGVAPGSGSVSAPRGLDAGPTTENRSGDGLAGVFSDAASGKGVLLFLLLAAFGWGAVHALSPGHGKAMVAAYLVGTRGTAKHALALGATVTITHTIGVFALGLVTLALSQYIVPEQLYPWLTVTSGLMVVIVGGGVLRSRMRTRRANAAHAHHDHADHGHAHDHADAHDHGHAHDHADAHDHGHAHDQAHAHDHAHAHDQAHAHDHAHPEHAHSHGGHTHSHAPQDLTWRGLLGMGASAGLIPCPSALVVLLGAISQHQVGLGLLLITVFSIGLAATLSGLGLGVVYTRSLLGRINVGRGGEIAAVLPSLSAVVIVAAGLVLTAHGIGQVH